MSGQVIHATPGHGGARPNSGRKVKTDQADHYTRLAKAKADHEEQKAVLAALERKQREGELIPAADVAKAFEDAGTRAKVRLLAVPDAVAPRLVNKTDIAEVEGIVRKAISDALRELRIVTA